MIVRYNAKISGTGRYVPDKILNNYDLEKIVETTDEWIRTRTGMFERHIAAEDQAVSDLGYEAALLALESANLKAKDLDMIIIASIYNDHISFIRFGLTLRKSLIRNSTNIWRNYRKHLRSSIYCFKITNITICDRSCKLEISTNTWA